MVSCAYTATIMKIIRNLTHPTLQMTDRENCAMAVEEQMDMIKHAASIPSSATPVYRAGIEPSLPPSEPALPPVNQTREATVKPNTEYGSHLVATRTHDRFKRVIESIMAELRVVKKWAGTTRTTIAAVTIQSIFRGYTSRRNHVKFLRAENTFLMCKKRKLEAILQEHDARMAALDTAKRLCIRWDGS